MRIATWNVNGLRARLEFVLHWLREREPDVVGLQEVKTSDEQFPSDAFAELGYQALYHGQKGWNGVAILTRRPARPTQRGLPGQAAQGARLLSAETDELRFTSVYCPNGKSIDHPDFEGKLLWLDALREHLAEQDDASRPAILCGDLNICPGPLDSWNEEGLRGSIFHTDAERARFQALLDAGFEDLFRALHPDTMAFSWWDYRGGAFHRKQGLRIDFLLGTRPVRKRLSRVEIDREWRKKHEGLTPSDHAPVWADLD